MFGALGFRVGRFLLLGWDISAEWVDDSFIVRVCCWAAAAVGGVESCMLIIRDWVFLVKVDESTLTRNRLTELTSERLYDGFAIMMGV